MLSSSKSAKNSFLFSARRRNVGTRGNQLFVQGMRIFAPFHATHGCAQPINLSRHESALLIGYKEHEMRSFAIIQALCTCPGAVC